MLSLLLAVIMVAGVLPVMASATAAAEGDTFELVTDATSLKAGDKVIIVAKDYGYALGTNQKSNNREAVSVTKTGNTVTATTATEVLTLEAGNKEGTYAFNTGSGYLYAASSSSFCSRTANSSS